jgi:phosphoglycolate phosphatase
MRSRLKLAVFDCDGTLVDSVGTIAACMTEAFACVGAPAPEAVRVRRIVGLPLDVAIQHLAPDLASTVHARIRDGYVDAFGARRLADALEEPLYPGTRELLEAWGADGWLLGIATGKGRRGLEATLGRHGLMPHFCTLQTADRVVGKPAPDMVLAAMAETGAEACDTVVIGDTSYDMEMARSAGAAAVGVAWGYHDADELRSAGAMVIVEDWAALDRAVAEVMEAHR